MIFRPNAVTSPDIRSTALAYRYLQCYDNRYATAVGNARTFELSTLPGSFDVSKAGSTGNRSYTTHLGHIIHKTFTTIAYTDKTCGVKTRL